MPDDLFTFAERKDKKATVEQIIQVVCATYGVTIEQLLERRRYKRNSPTQQFAKLAASKKALMYMLREFGSMQFIEIKKMFRYKDHTAVIFHVNDYRKLLSTDQHVARIHQKMINDMRKLDILEHPIANYLAQHHNTSMSTDLIKALQQIELLINEHGYRLSLVVDKDLKYGQKQ